jgi:hypothetical protein
MNTQTAIKRRSGAAGRFYLLAATSLLLVLLIAADGVRKGLQRIHRPAHGGRERRGLALPVDLRLRHPA